ncbi:hypothetical protein [Halococcus thailandensis]|uniref:hypothetical protein n=1 Tax=Halococcus thailandensis TaxID=335952 RepID=UPI001375740C|nr:hypothetical protein [Halococcus thailandensis]
MSVATPAVAFGRSDDRRAERSPRQGAANDPARHGPVSDGFVIDNAALAPQFAR